uniref:Uncharacterized protein n=1 Tax=Anguilla anguilla TaxID=7936 RepID=A0A0E9TUY1_ANGAN
MTQVPDQGGTCGTFSVHTGAQNVRVLFCCCNHSVATIRVKISASLSTAAPLGRDGFRLQTDSQHGFRNQTSSHKRASPCSGLTFQ